MPLDELNMQQSRSWFFNTWSSYFVLIPYFLFIAHKYPKHGTSLLYQHPSRYEKLLIIVLNKHTQRTHTGQNYSTYNFDCDSLRSLHLHRELFHLPSQSVQIYIQFVILEGKLTLAFCIHYAFMEKGSHLNSHDAVQKRPKQFSHTMRESFLTKSL